MNEPSSNVDLYVGIIITLTLSEKKISLNVKMSVYCHWMIKNSITTRTYRFYVKVDSYRTFKNILKLNFNCFYDTNIKNNQQPNTVNYNYF